jgi:hypothetical protein
MPVHGPTAEPGQVTWEMSVYGDTVVQTFPTRRRALMLARSQSLDAHVMPLLLALACLLLAPAVSRADCDLPCPPGSVQESEPCSDNTNGGCGLDPPAFEPISCGEVVCGTLWADASMHDTDWYELQTYEWGLVTWTANAEAPVQVMILDGNNGCAGVQVLAFATALACEPAIAETVLPPGTYWFWIASSEWSGYPCPVDYVASLDCEFVPPWYCDAGADTCDEYVQRVQLDTIDNLTGCGLGDEGVPGYSNYCATTARLTIGHTYDLTVTNGNPVYADDTCGAWIDWDGDALFTGAGESISMSGSPGVGPYTASFTVPPGLTGTVRLRIRIDWMEDPLPCGISTSGEVEDYELILAPDTPRGDLNCDGDVNAFDIDPFVDCLVNGVSTPPCVDCLAADIDQSGSIDAFDIDPFVACVANQGCP